MNSAWYAIRSKPHKEHALWKQLQSREIEVYYPRLKVEPINPRSSKIRPYFPGYLFVKTDLQSLGISKFSYLPFSNGLVSFGGVPAPIQGGFIDVLRRRVDELNELGGEVFDGLTKGDRVKIEHGPLEGYEAIFEARLPGRTRVKLLLEFLSGQYAQVEMDSAYISRQAFQGAQA